MVAVASTVYVIDTCALMDLQGYNVGSEITVDENVRECLWQGLERLIDDKRLLTVRAVRDELKRRAPICYDRLKPRFRRFVVRDSVGLFTEVIRIQDTYPALVRDLEKRTNGRDPADPYLVAHAKLNGHVLVTSELGRSQRTRNNRRGIHIPDVCSTESIICKNLIDLITEESLWP